MAWLTRLILVCAGTLLLAGCADSELNARASNMFPIRQMDAFFGSGAGSPELAPPAPADMAPQAAGLGYQPAYPPETGYAPAYPPYPAEGQDRLSSD